MVDGLGAVLQAARDADGVFTTSDAALHGVDRQALARACQAGLVVRLARGVYVAGGVPETWRRRVRVAVMAARPDGAAARITALRLHELVSGAPAIHVLVPYGADVGRRGDVRLHRSRSFGPDQRVHVAGIAVTTVARALVESWTGLGPRRWIEVVARALRDGAVGRGELHDTLDVMGRVAGAGRMRREIDARPAPLDRARSQAEERLAGLLREAGYESVVLNHEVVDADGRLIAEIDAAVPGERLGFELDSRPWHSLPGQVVKDEIKDLRLSVLGWRIHRIPLRLVDEQPRHAARLLRALRPATPPAHGW